MDQFDFCIIGAGVIGLAIGRRLAHPGASVLLLERNHHYGTETSSRNSEVIHAGIYYPTGSLKARLCVAGREALYDYCQRNGISHRRLGKLIVAGSDQTGELEALQAKAEANGVSDLQWMDQRQLRALEPQVAAQQALLSPSTGIISAHELMDTLAGEFEAHGGLLSLSTGFEGSEPRGEGFAVRVSSGGEPYEFHCRGLINSAGLHATRVARRMRGLAPEAVPELHYCKGHYFALQGRAPFSHLIYPMPEANTAGLGIHATLDLGGSVRFGPDTLYLDALDYRMDDGRRDSFARAIWHYYPQLDPGRLTPAYAGIRPKLAGPGEPARDFLIDQPLAGLINLFGMESPGLTASLAVADYVAAALEDRLP